MTKSELRAVYLAKQKSLSAAERNEKSRRIAGTFFERFDLSRLRLLHLFLPIEKNKEIETAFIFQKIWKDFKDMEIIVSHIDFATLTLENVRFTPRTELVANRWDILEPVTGEAVEIERIDAVVVPLLSFDERGFRVGYGKGFYDKFLSECRADCLKIGLSYFAPVEEISDAQKFDVKLDFCITPDTVSSFETNRE